MKKYINIYAYFQQNLGDDLMIDILLKRFENYRFYTERTVNNPYLLKNKNFISKEACLAKYGKLSKFINKLPWNKAKESYEIRKLHQIESGCFCSAFIGGSIFVQRDSLTIEDVQWRLNRNNSYLQQGPLFVIGANFGAYSTDNFREAYESHFRKCAGVSFRDKASYDMFSHIPAVQYASDVVFSLEDLPKGRKDSNEILISVVDITQKYGIEQHVHEYEQLIVDFCKYVLSLGKTPVLMSFCKYEGDEDAIERILAQIGQDRSKVNTYFYNGDMQSALQKISDAEFILATRFHAMVLAMKFKKPFYTLSYDLKIKNVMSDLECDLYCEVDKLANISPKDILKYDFNVPNLDRYMSNSKDHFNQLEKFLERI